MEELTFLISGLIFCATSGVLYFLIHGIKKRGVVTKAKVKNHRFRHDQDGGELYEVFEFTDQLGKLHHSKSIMGSSFGLYSLGDFVDVIYDEDDPTRVVPNHSILLNLYLLPLTVGVILIGIHFFNT